MRRKTDVDELYYDIIFKRKSFHIFSGVSRLSDENSLPYTEATAPCKRHQYGIPDRTSCADQL